MKIRLIIFMLAFEETFIAKARNRARSILPKSKWDDKISGWGYTVRYFLVTPILLMLILLTSERINAQAPFTVKSGLFDTNKPETMGLTKAEGTETYTIFRPTDNTYHYNHQLVLAPFKGSLYAMWQSSATNEDTPDTKTVFSKSQDGKIWTTPADLAVPFSGNYCTSGGWWTREDSLIAYINVWFASTTPRQASTYYMATADGIKWTKLKPVLMSDGTQMKAQFEQDPHVLPDGRIICAGSFQTGLQACPVYTDDASGTKGWEKASYTPISSTSVATREMEPSCFFQNNGSIVMIFRDQGSTYRSLASISTDRGKFWTTAVVSDMLDSRSKQSAGNLPDGTAYIVNNPAGKGSRIPLAVTLSKDGKNFDKSYVIRQGGSDHQTQRYPGKAKTLGFSYPKSVVWNGFLYVGYCTNKEDVQYSRIPLTSLGVTNLYPVISFTAPTNNATYALDTPILFSVNVSDSDGSIAKVEYFNGSISIGSVTSNPFTFNWTNATADTYTITAKATDNMGATTTSSAINIVVNAKPTDCAGIENGTATLDNCDRCIGGTTGNTACTSVVEAEDEACNFDGILESKNAGFKGTGYINVENAVGSGITFNIKAATAGSKTLSFRYASSATGDRAATIRVNGSAQVSNLSFPLPVLSQPTKQ